MVKLIKRLVHRGVVLPEVRWVVCQRVNLEVEWEVAEAVLWEVHRAVRRQVVNG